MKNLTEKLMIAILPPFMLFLVAPLTFYYGNINEITFTLADVWFSIAGLFFASSLFLFLLLTATSKLKRIYLVLSGLLLGLSVAVWVQSQLFVWDFGPLDGRGIDWAQWSMHMGVEFLVWLVLFVSSIYLFLKQRDKITKFVIQTFLVLGLISIFSSSITGPEPKNFKSHSPISSEKIFQFHPENNTLVILLDTFQSDFFELIAEKYPSEVAFLTGFTFYRNTISKHPTTAPNMPAIMTTSAYDNQQSLDIYIENAYETYNIQSAFKQKNYSTEVISFPQAIPIDIGRQQVLDSFSERQVASLFEFLDFGIFRSVPTYCKNNVYNNGDWLFAFLASGKKPLGIHGIDIRLLEFFEDNAKIGIDDGSGFFAFYHFALPHPPWGLTKN